MLPFVLPTIGMYMSLVMYTAFAQAYKVGKERLQTDPIAADQ